MTFQRLFPQDMTFLVLLKKKLKNLSVNFEFRYNCILSECFADVAIFQYFRKLQILQSKYMKFKTLSLDAARVISQDVFKNWNFRTL